jgi:membrane protein YdbS with pleckstrin-like domain
LPLLPFASIDLAWWYALPIGSLLLGLITALYVVMDARVRGWALREHDLIYRYGIFWRKTVILPFARIQHVEAIQGPLERYFDLMRLKCFTAGGLSADLVVKGLDSASARRVRGFLLEQIAASGPADGEDGLEDDERI